MTIAHQTSVRSHIFFSLFLQGCNSQLQIPLPCTHGLHYLVHLSPRLMQRQEDSSPSKTAHAFGDTLISALVTAFRPSAAQPSSSSYEALTAAPDARCSRPRWAPSTGALKHDFLQSIPSQLFCHILSLRRYSGSICMAPASWPRLV
jgi:hypothetical protein